MPALINGLPVITTSSRSTFRRCPQRWYWQYVDGLTPKGELPDALWFGIGVHEALAEWYQMGFERGRHPADVFEDWCDDQERQINAAYPDHERNYEEKEPAKFENALELGTSMLEGYFDVWGDDPNWEVIAIERPFKVRVMKDGVPIAYFMSTWDGVYRDLRSGLIYLMEHKTATQIQTAFLELDDQAGIYWAFAQPILRKDGTLAEDEEIAGIQYNYLRKAKKDERDTDEHGRALNKNGTVSKRQPIPRFVRPTPVERSVRERKTQINRLANEASIMTGIMAGEIPVTKNTSKDCPFCPFFTMCKLHERGGKAWQQIAQVDFVEAEPYDRYLKSAAA